MSKGKKFKGKTCAYCAKEGVSGTADHIFARQFFPLAKRENLPQAPACFSCNNKKSKLETYLAAVLPFGGRHADSTRMLDEVPKRLARNARLQRELAAGLKEAWVWENGLLVQTAAIPFDSDQLAKLFGYIARGLASYHWGVTIPAHYNVRSGALKRQGEPIFEKLLAMESAARTSESWGDGTFAYEGIQSAHDPALTVWRFSAHGGLEMSGDNLVPHETASTMWVTSSGIARPGILNAA